MFSGKSLSVIVASKHSLCGPALGDPGLLCNTKEIERKGKSLPAPKHFITIMIVMHN